MLHAFLMRGVPQDGVRLDPPVEHPDTLFAIGFDDGAHRVRPGSVTVPVAVKNAQAGDATYFVDVTCGG